MCCSRIQFVYGGQGGPIRGRTDSGDLQVFTLSQDEYITSVTAEAYPHPNISSATYAGYLGKLTFVTNMRVSDTYGWGGGGTISLVAGSELRWISGVDGNYLYRIEFNFEDDCC